MKRRIKKLIVITLAVLALTGTLFMQNGFAITANAGSAQSLAAPAEQVTLSLNRRNSEENMRFQAENMLPGDTLTGIYRIETSFQDKEVSTLHFGVVLQDGSEKLAEVLQLKVALTAPEAKVLYEGAFDQMPQSLDYVIDSEAEVVYEISASLDTSVGNEYQGKKLVADFVWWADAEEIPTTDPNEGGIDEGDGSDSNEDGSSAAGESGTTDADGTGNGSVTPPPTGDMTPIGIMIFAAVVSAVLLCLLFILRRIKMRKLTSIGIMFILLLGLGVTAYALTLELKTVEENTFTTGTISISVNESKTVFTAEDILLEPGATLEKEVQLVNDGTGDVYYRLYADQILEQKLSGESWIDLESADKKCADELVVLVSVGTEPCFVGSLSEMLYETAEAFFLETGAEAPLKITVYMPEELSNDMQDRSMEFDIVAEAVQAKNNPNREFTSR